MIRVKMIQQVEQLSVALQKCDNSWVAEQIVAHKIKNKRDNLHRKLPDKATRPESRSGTPGQGGPRPSASSSFNSVSSTVAMDDDDGNNLDDGPQCAEPHDDVASETSFQTATVNPTTAATRRAEIKSIHSTTSRRGRGGARGGCGRGARQQSTTKTQSLSMTQSFINKVPVPMERKPSRKVRENKEVEEVISAKRKADEELKEGRAKIAKKSRANLEGLFKKWAQEAGEVYEEVEREILWLGGVKFLGTYEGRRQIWTQAEPDDVEVDDEDIED
jgi:hypothetical protein